MSAVRSPIISHAATRQAILVRRGEVRNLQMATIQVSKPGSDAFVDPVTVYPAGVLPLIPEQELTGTRVRMHHRGDDDEPQLFEVRVDPLVELASHAHETSEIIVVLDGELHMGARLLPAGTSILVPANTLYSFRAGEQGARFLNFRPMGDYTYITPSQFMARRRGGSASTP